MRASFDTNILVYAVDRAEERKHSLAVKVIGWASRADCIFTVQALGEIFNVVTRKTGLDLAEAEGFIDDWRSVFPVASATPDCLTSAIQAVHHHGLTYWDAMLWATARDTGCGLRPGHQRGFPGRPHPRWRHLRQPLPGAQRHPAARRPGADALEAIPNDKPLSQVVGHEGKGALARRGRPG